MGRRKYKESWKLEDPKARVEEFRERISQTQAIEEDYKMREIINEDISQIYEEQGYQDGMMDKRPFSCVRRGGGYVRIYVFLPSGGLGIFSEEGNKEARRQIFTLGEDDGWYFLHGRRIYEEVWCSKSEFVYGLSELLSMWNNIEI